MQQETWMMQQIRSMHHILALLGIAGIVGSAGFFHDDSVVYVGYLLFFLVTAWSMLKTMILFSIIIGVLVAIFPFLAPIAFIAMLIFFFMRLEYVSKHWRAIVVGLLVYGFGVFLVYFRQQSILLFLIPPLRQLFYYAFSYAGAMVVPLADALFCAAVVHFLLTWLYRNGYDSKTALGVMGAVPLVLIALLLPFLKVFADSGPAVDFGDAAHGGQAVGGEHVGEGYGVKAPSGYTYVNSYVRTAPDGIVENNLSYHGDGAHQSSSPDLQVVKGHWRSNPDGIAENNLSYHGQPSIQQQPIDVTSGENVRPPYVYDYNQRQKQFTALKDKIANHKAVFAIAAAVVLSAAGYLSYQYFSALAKPTDYSLPVAPVKQQQAVPAVLPQAVKTKQLESKDIYLAGVKPGDNIATARKTADTAWQIERGKEVTRYKVPTLGVEYTVMNRQGYIGGIVVDKNLLATARGIRVGDPVNKVLSAYGDAVISSYGQYDLYEYFYQDAPQYILRFAIDKQSKKVDYISVRAVVE